MFNRFWSGIFASFLLSTSWTQAQSPPGKFWQSAGKIAKNRPASDAWVQPEKSHAFNVDRSALAASLGKAPKEFSKEGRVAPAEIILPMPDGSSARFRIVESSILAPELAAKFPEIKTYLGQGVDDPTATARIDSTPEGFHAQILSSKGAVYIDPFWRGNRVLHTSYYKRDYRKGADGFQCLAPEANVAEPAPADPAPRDLLRSGNNLRIYRLACAATGEYVQFSGGTVSSGMSAIATAINRVTGIYEVELAIRLVLVANNNLIVYTNPGTDPYTNDNGSLMLGQNQSTLDSVIGSANYDIGHVFSTAGGGIATLGVVCRTGNKARGVTGTSMPTGDAFYVDYVAHEMGHQFGANHTFNSVSGFCSGNRNSSTAFEPGSGSTLLAYAGICDADDLQPHSDPYFHCISFDEIVAYSTTGLGSGCPLLSGTGNNAPSVNAGLDYSIPKGTPFTLTATGSDPDGDALTYCWEERDLGPSQTASSVDNGSSPLFRSLNPTNSASRTFPKISSILGNTSVVGEKLPTVGRTMNFRVTARDNRGGGGGVSTDDMKVTVSSSAGPFIVTSPNTAVNWAGVRSVTWNVAGTTASPISAANVNILLSTDGGNSFPIVLASNTPNDGIETVRLPAISTTSARIKVEAAGNIFFDISDANFSIMPSANGAFITLVSGTLAAENCGTGNNAIDPGETVAVNFTLQNVGFGNTTNLTATLLATNGIAAPGGAQDYGALGAGGAAVTRTFSFTAGGVCGGTIRPVLHLQDGTKDLGMIDFSFALGTASTASLISSNTGTISIPTMGAALPYPSSIFLSNIG
ncbi:MAG: zinc-dependent metalloprotease family protein, partial [Verrucomicrobiota bacterium]